MGRTNGLWLVSAVAAGFALTVPAAGGGQEEPAQRQFTVAAKRYQYAPARIEVNQNDLVKVTLTSEDIAHSFTVDAYRIAKRVGGGQAVTFEFRADQAGRFPIYCNLQQDSRCREMQGELVVAPR